MNRREFGFALALVSAALLALARSADAAAITNGDPVGANYKIDGISAGAKVDFTAHAPVMGTDQSMGQNNNTIGRMTLTLSHAGLVWLGFDLKQNVDPDRPTSLAGGGLRFLLDVVDTNAMTVDWIDYHIRATDSDFAGDDTGGHKKVAHFHDTTSGYGGSSLVAQGDGDNVIALAFGLGAPVAPTAIETVSHILVHERDFMGVTRNFRVETIPSIPEPTTFALAAIGMLGLIVCARRRRSIA